MNWRKRARDYRRRVPEVVGARGRVERRIGNGGKKKRTQRGTRRAAKVERTIARQAAVKTSPRIHSESHSHSRLATPSSPGKCQRRRFHDERRGRGPPCSPLHRDNM